MPKEVLCVKYDETNGEFSIIAARNINSESINDLSGFSSGILKNVVEKEQPLVFHDAQNDPNLSQYESVLLSHIKSVIGVPIFRDGKIWGVIVADSQSKP